MPTMYLAHNRATRYFAHHESDCAWREPNCTEEAVDKILHDSCGTVEEISKEHFLELEKRGYSVEY